MPHFKDTENKLHFLDDASFIHLLPEGSIQITSEEAEALRQPPPETHEQIIARLDRTIENHIQSVITGLGYVSIERLAIYTNSTNAKWKAEALGAPLWITAVWEKAIDVMNAVKDGNRDVPTEAELLALMPKLEDFVTY